MRVIRQGCSPVVETGGLRADPRDLIRVMPVREGVAAIADCRLQIADCRLAIED
jgi:hypothetical protein